jgi:hypothetical protein
MLMPELIHILKPPLHKPLHLFEQPSIPLLFLQPIHRIQILLDILVVAVATADDVVPFLEGVDVRLHFCAPVADALVDVGLFEGGDDDLSELLFVGVDGDALVDGWEGAALEFVPVLEVELAGFGLFGEFGEGVGEVRVGGEGEVQGEDRIGGILDDFWVDLVPAHDLPAV